MDNKDILEKLDDIRRLLILKLYKDGNTTKVIGDLLGVSYKTIERILPKATKGK